MAEQSKIRSLDDLALKAGVTAATVSLALRNSPRLSEEVRDRIRLLAEENDFTPRSYRRRTVARKVEVEKNSYGPLLVLYYEFPGVADPMRDGIMPPLFLLLNERKIEYQYVNVQEFMANPDMAKDFRGIIYYNDPEDMRLPDDIPSVQIFGWAPLRPRQDRITANDEQIVRLVAENFSRNGVSRAAMVCCREMLPIEMEHPRVEGFLKRMKQIGVDAELILFDRYSMTLTSVMQEYLKDEYQNVGLFAFNAFCGLKLCCALDSLGLIQAFGPQRLVVCDNSPLLYSFSPRPTMIDLNLPMLAEFALDALCRRLERPELPETVLQQAPKIVIYPSK